MLTRRQRRLHRPRCPRRRAHCCADRRARREIDTVKAQMGTKMEAEKTIKSVMDDTLGQASI